MKQMVLVAALVAVVIVIVFTLHSKQPNPTILIFEDGEADFRSGVDRYTKDNKLKINPVTIRVDQPVSEVEKNLRKYHSCYAIGPRISSEALTLLPYLEKFQIFTIAPLVTSPKVVGKSKYLMSLSPSDELQARDLVERLQKDLRKSTVVICDRNNIAYSESLFQMMVQFSPLSFDCLYIDSVDELVNFDFSKYDSVVLIVDGRVAGLVAQLALRKGFNGIIYGSDYAYTDALITTGSSAVEGMILYGLFDLSQMTKFGFTSLEHAGSYDALMVILTLVSSKIKTTEASNYLQGKTFKGATGTFTVSSDLSVFRTTNFVTVRNAQFIADEVKK
ncbi:MAG TPA: hypothetical protein PLP64_05160 [Pseudothermotoga sp.]|nr:hypothetical protein [Pseudothermotoga sp.]HOK83597.1 hypothetical protein [Pseudothermotoga sp.]HPP69236.1 hypothetical protein [Pseudothermotoga sp.]